MTNIKNNYRKNTKAFWKFVNGLVKSSKDRVDTLIDGSGNRFLVILVRSKF